MLSLPQVHDKYAELVILAINFGMIITVWSAENDGSRMFAGENRWSAKSYRCCIGIFFFGVDVYQPSPLFVLFGSSRKPPAITITSCQVRGLMLYPLML